MISFEVLNAVGSTNSRLREIFTKRPGPAAPDGSTEQSEEDKIRDRVETEIQDRLQEKIGWCAQNGARYSAIDMAWDTSVLNRTTIPLLLYAQGKINVKTCAESLQGLPNASRYLKKDEKGEVKEIDLPLFVETDCNLVRSMVTRRLAAQANKYANLWPYYKFESRSTGMKGKLRADAMSQVADIMADQFGYREHDKDVYRDGFLYPHVLDFVRSRWEIERQHFPKDVAEEFETSALADLKPEELEKQFETKIVKEGVCFFNPHPSRVFWDNAHALNTINSDTGVEFLGFWDITRFRNIRNNPAYWNRDVITYGSGGLWQVYLNYQTWFQQYYVDVSNPIISVSSTMPLSGTVDLAAQNDRLNNMGVYSQDDSSVFIANYFVKKKPIDIGCGKYPFPVWFRFVVAGDRTVIFAEILPSTPAAYLGINESSHRLNNISFAEEILGFQDQLTNLQKHLLRTIEQDQLKILAVNKDVVGEDGVKTLRAKFEGNAWSGKPLVVEYSAKEWANMGMQVRDNVVHVEQTHLGQSVAVILQGMARVIQMAEELAAMSPAEKGQPAPREISATEVNEMAATTSTVYTFISDAIDSYHSAKKKIIYESTIACKKGEVRVPVVNRYSEPIIKGAGFEVVADEDEDESSRPQKRRTILGTRKALLHDYIFTTRDGAERPVNVQAANTLVQLLAQILPIPTVLQALGKEKLYELLNEIFRLIGAGFDLKLELSEGEDNSLGGDPIQELTAQFEQLAQATQQVAQEVQAGAQKDAEQDAVNQQQDAALKGLVEMAKEVKRIAEKLSKVEDGQENFKKDMDSRLDEVKPSVSLPYDKTPPSVQRQIEYNAGYKPASEAEHIAHINRLKPKPKPPAKKAA